MSDALVVAAIERGSLEGGRGAVVLRSELGAGEPLMVPARLTVGRGRGLWSIELAAIGVRSVAEA